MLGRNSVSKVEPVGTVGSKKLPLSLPSPTFITIAHWSIGKS